MAPGSARGDDTPESEKSGTREYWIWEYRVPEYRNMQNPGKKKKNHHHHPARLRNAPSVKMN